MGQGNQGMEANQNQLSGCYLVSDELSNDGEKRISEILVMYNYKIWRLVGVGNLFEGHS